MEANIVVLGNGSKSDDGEIDGGSNDLECV